jgi:glyoxylase-like metal-dependent hydrolase (beta-lactamase superfamily II)
MDRDVMLHFHRALFGLCLIFAGRAAALEAHRVAQGVYYFEGATGQADRANRGFTSNAGFVVTRDGVLVFDALGTPVLAREMLAAIEDVTRKPVRRVIVSHYHADHVYGLQVFKDAGAEIWAHRDGQIYLASDLARERLTERRASLAPWVDDDTRLVSADRWIAFGDEGRSTFRFGGQQFTLIQAGPAHAPEDMMLFVERSRVLFAGDVFFSGRLPFVVDGNTRGWLATIERIKRTDARVVIPGHGPASHDVDRDLQNTERYLIALRTQMRAAVEALEGFDEALARGDWREFAGLPTFDVAHRRNAYSVYLEVQAELLGDVADEER